MKLDIGLSEEHLKKSNIILKGLLADEMTLYGITRSFHWNVSGDGFMEAHKLFETQYRQIELTIDLVAERIAKLGGRKIGTMKECVEITRLKDPIIKEPTQAEMMKHLVINYELIIKQLRKDIEKCVDKNNDAGTADLLTQILIEHETTAWILRRYLS